ncbi:hypothetical protein [Methylobacterium iners]|uniref:Uncharacterized protein n=1 Tax=Methylobacterium iners TaxID=418707 RepID=A0ABQ4RVQ6_9HYPH|nr:hypothetical protein [Methylobacterium iners]GJD94676.1 hypothetical protein OCOJLMKI_1879 [Methylobacterium iners]
MKSCFAAAIAGLVALSGPALAETPEETAFGFGQFTGAATFCKIPREKVNQVASALLESAGIDASGPSPAMKRFTEGVADGVPTMSGPEASSCADVTTAFNEAYDKIQ